MSGRHLQGKKCPKKTKIKTYLQSKGYTPPLKVCKTQMLTKYSRSILYPSPQSVQNSNTDQRQSEYPSFAFGTDGALRPCVLASPLGPK